MRPRLLIVQDGGRMLLDFTGQGWEVVLASTVAEGLTLLDPAPDYLILDLRLPDGSGEAILRRCRELGLKTLVAVRSARGQARPSPLSPDALLATSG